MSHEIKIKVAGMGYGDLIVETFGGSRCGEIKNGVACRFEEIRGRFVIDKADLLKLFTLLMDQPKEAERSE